MSETIEAPDTSDDLRSVLSAAFDAGDAPQSDVQTEHPPPRPDRARDEHGRFTRAEQEAAEGAAAEHTDTTDQPATTTDEPAQQAIDPPASWSEAEKAHWASLTREVQETVLRRERDIDKGLAERATESQAVAPLREVLAPYREKHAMLGITDAEAVRRLLAAQEMLEQNPDRAFPELARAFGYDLRRLIPTQQVPPQQQRPQQQQPQPQQFRDPRVDEMLRRDQHREQQQALSAVETFGKDPAHPHFQEVRQHMGVLLQNGGASDLQDAYDKAVWAMPATREKLLADRERTAQAGRDTAAKQKVEQARRASVSVRDNASAGGTGAAAPAAASLREELERAWVQ